MKYKGFRKGFDRAKRLSLKRDKRLKGLRKIDERMVVLKKKLDRVLEKTKGKGGVSR